MVVSASLSRTSHCSRFIGSETFGLDGRLDERYNRGISGRFGATRPAQKPLGSLYRPHQLNMAHLPSQRWSMAAVREEYFFEIVLDDVW